MKKILRKIIGGGSLAAVITVIAPAFSAMAWGPQRTTFTNANPATYVTFNSITDNVKLGDETNFVRVREKDTGDFVDEVEIAPGKEYEVYIYYHNNASSNLGLTAEDTRVFSYFPGFIAGGETKDVGAKISASNAKPRSVWDEASFINTSANGVMLKYVEGTAKIENKTYNNNAGWTENLPEELFTGDGTLIGYGALDGNLPGCAEYSGVITYTVKVEQPQFYLSKLASKDGENYYDHIFANVGDMISYKVIVKNPGTAAINFTSIHDILASGLEAVDGSVRMSRRNPAATGDCTLSEPCTFGDAFFTPAGIGPAAGSNWTFEPDTDGSDVGGMVLTYVAKVTEDALQGEDCGRNKLINGAWASYVLKDSPSLGGIIANHAIVEVDVPCLETPPEMPRTGVDGGEMLMTILVVASLMGACIYAIYGVQIMHRKVEVSVKNDMSMGGQPNQEI